MLAGAIYITTYINIFIGRLCDMQYVLLTALQLQKSPAGTMLPQHGTSWIQPLSTQSQLCQQKMRLQSLQMERERLKLRQQEIMRQVIPCSLVLMWADWPINCTERSPCHDTGSCPASCKFPHLLWNLKVHYSVQWSPDLPPCFMKCPFI
jgi:hypothetical protein